MIFARKEIKMNGYRKQSPEIKTTISHDDKTVTVYLYYGEQIKCIPEFPNFRIIILHRKVGCGVGMQTDF